MFKEETWLDSKAALELGFATSIEDAPSFNGIATSGLAAVLSKVRGSLAPTGSNEPEESQASTTSQAEGRVRRLKQIIWRHQPMTIELGGQGAAKGLALALSAGTVEEVASALESYSAGLYETMRSEYEALIKQGDQATLAQSGYKQLTAEEHRFIAEFIKAGKSSNPKQELLGLLELDHGMPESLIRDVFTDMLAESPLLRLTRQQYMHYTTVWGEINSTATKMITERFRAKFFTLNKLSAYVAYPKDMLEMGHSFIEAYMRKAFAGAFGAALERAVLAGDGNQKPIGVNRDISSAATVVAGAYPLKTPVPITDFSPKTYGELLTELTVTELGEKRALSSVALVVSPKDYFTKIMPAITALNVSGSYVANLFPFPTTVVQSVEAKDGEAYMFIPSEYWLSIGCFRNGGLESYDEYRFLEDQRVVKAITHVAGGLKDNTSSIVLDISNLEEAYITVKHK